MNRTAVRRRSGTAPAAGLAVLLLSTAAAAESPQMAGPSEDPWQLCAHHSAAAEARQDLPPHLLTAISKVESGRWHAEREEILAWPWTVMAEGKGRYLPNKAAAIAEVRRLRAKGVRNIDVGCMQVNLYHHPDAFEGLEAAFDPASNVDYAARLLARLRQEARSWTKAIAFYHSRTPAFNGPYRLKVFRAWREERHRANRARRAGQVALREDQSSGQRGSG